MARYHWRDGRFVDRQTGEPMPIPVRAGVCMPQIQRDIPDYISPVSGELIKSRSGQRDDLKRHDCVLSPPPAKRREPKSAKARARVGLPPLEN